MVRCPRIWILVLTLSCLALLSSIAPPAIAVCQHRHKSCVQCPHCQACCDLDVKKEDEKKHCWKVECKEICVPRVVFPWQNRGKHQLGHSAGGHCTDGCTSCCEDGGCSGGGCARCCHNGAWVKTVRVLKKHAYTCPTCSYSWTPRKPACSRCDCSGDNCTCSGSYDELRPIGDEVPEEAPPVEETVEPEAELTSSPIDEVQFEE